MLDPVERVPWSNLSPDVIDSDTHREMALRVARESMTLLKNDNNLLPLSKDLKRVAVIGANAADSVMLWETITDSLLHSNHPRWYPYKTP